MLAAHLGSGHITVKQAALPPRPPATALLRLRLAGVCNTDLELLRGYYHFTGIPGHEFVATVVDCDNPALLHKRVVGEINLPCGNCDFCAIGLTRHCRHRSVLGILHHPGAFAEFLTLPEANLHIVPETVSDREAVFVEPLAAACEILDQIPLTAGDEVAVLGDGKLGLLVTQVLLVTGASVVLYGHHESKLSLARSFGAAAVLADDSLPLSRYRYVVECTGSSAGLQSAISMTMPRGSIVMKSTVHDRIQIDTAPVIVNELSLIGSRCGRFEPALRLLSDKQVAVEPMISGEFGLSEAPAAFAEAARKGVLKVLLYNDQCAE